MDDDEEQTQDDAGDNLSMSHDQLMELLNHVAEQRNLPIASPYQPQPQQQQAPVQPKPQAAPIPANVPQTGKVLDQASGAYIRPDTAKNLDWFRQTGDAMQQQDQEQAKQQAANPQNPWQQIYTQLRKQNPQATPQQLLMSMKAYKDAGAFETYSKSAIGKTVEEQLYAAAIKEGKTPEEAAKFVQENRGISPEIKGLGAKDMELGKKQADLQINQPKAVEKLQDMNDGMDNTIKFINLARKQVSGMTTGFLGAMGSKIAGTPSYDLAQTISTVKSNIGFDKLQSMKDESPTGSALGRVTNMEMQILQNVVANLEQGQSKDQFNMHLDIAEQEVNKAKKRIAEAYDMTYGSGGAQAVESMLGGQKNETQQPSSGDSDPLGLFK